MVLTPQHVCFASGKVSWPWATPRSSLGTRRHAGAKVQQTPASPRAEQAHSSQRQTRPGGTQQQRGGLGSLPPPAGRRGSRRRSCPLCQLTQHFHHLQTVTGGSWQSHKSRWICSRLPGGSGVVWKIGGLNVQTSSGCSTVKKQSCDEHVLVTEQTGSEACDCFSPVLSEFEDWGRAAQLVTSGTYSQKGGALLRLAEPRWNVSGCWSSGPIPEAKHKSYILLSKCWSQMVWWDCFFQDLTSRDVGRQEVMVVSLALEMLRYLRVVGHEQLSGMEL